MHFEIDFTSVINRGKTNTQVCIIEYLINKKVKPELYGF